MKKRILSAFLCLCMMLTLAPAAFAVGEGDSGENENKAPNVTAATLHDTRLDDDATKAEGIADSDLYTGESNATDEWTPVDQEENSYTSNVTLTFKDVQRHQNKEKNMGYWVGFFVKAPTGTKTAKYAFSETPDTPLEEDAEQGIAFYFDAEKPKSTVCSVEFFGEVANGEAPRLAKVVYTVKFDGVSIKKEETPAVEMKADLENAEDGTLKIEPNSDTTKKELLLSGTIKASAFGTDYKTTPKVTISFAKDNATYVGTLKYDVDTKEVAFTPENEQKLPTDYTDYKVVSKITVEPTTEEPTTGIKVTDFHYIIDDSEEKLNGRVDDKAQEFIISGDMPEALVANSAKVPAKLTYTVDGETKYFAILMHQDETSTAANKLTYSEDTTGHEDQALPEGYKINLSEIKLTKADEPTVDLPEAVDDQIKAPVTDVEAIPEANQEAATTVAASVTTENTTDIANAAAKELTDIVADEVEPGQKVEVFLAVTAKEYKVENEVVESFKLDITPMYQVKTEDGKEIPDKPAKQLTTIATPITIKINLPAGFAAKGAKNVFARHTHNGVPKLIDVTVYDTDKGSFEMAGFSDVEIFKNDDSVKVKYHPESSMKQTEYTYTMESITAKVALQADTKEDHTFKGWALTENSTTAKYKAESLTEDILKTLISDVKNGVVDLYPVFEKTGSSDNPSSPSGSGGGSKRPDSSNNNNNTTTPTTPSDYGNNPSTPSTPSTPVSSTGFSDVAAGGWYESAVQYMKDNGLMAGTSATTFAPDATTTRGMIVTILYRLEKEPEAAASTFSDIAAGEWYSNAVAWAAANNIVSGYENGTFGANDVITREQMAAILFRYASFKGYDVTKTADISSFADAAQVSAYAADAMKWANAAGLISGTSATTLAPTGSATRAQAASILMRFCENVAK